MINEYRPNTCFFLAVIHAQFKESSIFYTFLIPLLAHNLLVVLARCNNNYQKSFKSPALDGLAHDTSLSIRIDNNGLKLKNLGEKHNLHKY